jgi:hypothetical protein
MVSWLRARGTLPIYLSKIDEIGDDWKISFLTCTAYIHNNVGVVRSRSDELGIVHP